MKATYKCGSEHSEMSLNLSECWMDPDRISLTLIETRNLFYSLSSRCSVLLLVPSSHKTALLYMIAGATSVCSVEEVRRLFWKLYLPSKHTVFMWSIMFTWSNLGVGENCGHKRGLKILSQPTLGTLTATPNFHSSNLALGSIPYAVWSKNMACV